MKNLIFCTCVAFLALNLNSRSEASGSYDSPSKSAPSGPSTRAEGNRPASVDTEKYRMGQNLYLGKTTLPDEIISAKLLEKQSRSLEKYKKNLPRTLPKVFVDRLDVGKFAGRLKKKEYDSLLYYFNLRYVRPISRG